MKVLFVITNINGFHEIPYSFGLSSLASYIELKGHTQQILDVRTTEEYDKLFDRIDDFKPDVVGFTSVSSQFSCVSELAEKIREKHAQMKIVCGGVHTTIFPESVAECAAFDCVFVGESEHAFAGFLDALEANEDWRGGNNIAFVTGGEVVVKDLNPLITDIGSLPFPAKGPLFEETIKAQGTAIFFFSRGCPYQCTYCSNHAIAACYGLKTNRPRYRDVDSCLDEILETMEMYEFQKILIGDDTFGIDRKWRTDFLTKYKQDIDKPFHCLLRANLVDEEFIAQLKEAGCYRISFGVESGSEYIRNEVMKRNLSEKQIINAFHLCKKYGIETIALNIIGVPGETEAMIKETVRLNRIIKPTGSGVNIFYPYKGTQLGDYCFSQGLVDEKMYYDFSNERRDSVLTFESEYKDILRNYQDRWTLIVDPWNVKKRLVRFVYDHKYVHIIARYIKRSLSRILKKA